MELAAQRNAVEAARQRLSVGDGMPSALEDFPVGDAADTRTAVKDMSEAREEELAALVAEDVAMRAGATPAEAAAAAQAAKLAMAGRDSTSSSFGSDRSILPHIRNISADFSGVAQRDTGGSADAPEGVPEYAAERDSEGGKQPDYFSESSRALSLSEEPALPAGASAGDADGGTKRRFGVVTATQLDMTEEDVKWEYQVVKRKLDTISCKNEELTAEIAQLTADLNVKEDEFLREQEIHSMDHDLNQQERESLVHRKTHDASVWDQEVARLERQYEVYQRLEKENDQLRRLIEDLLDAIQRESMNHAETMHEHNKTAMELRRLLESAFRKSILEMDTKNQISAFNDLPDSYKSALLDNMLLKDELGLQTVGVNFLKMRCNMDMQQLQKTRASIARLARKSAEYSHQSAGLARKQKWIETRKEAMNDYLAALRREHEELVQMRAKLPSRVRAERALAQVEKLVEAEEETQRVWKVRCERLERVDVGNMILDEEEKERLRAQQQLEKLLHKHEQAEKFSQRQRRADSIASSEAADAVSLASGSLLRGSLSLGSQSRKDAEEEWRQMVHTYVEPNAPEDDQSDVDGAMQHILTDQIAHERHGSAFRGLFGALVRDSSKSAIKSSAAAGDIADSAGVEDDASMLTTSDKSASCAGNDVGDVDDDDDLSLVTSEPDDDDCVDAVAPTTGAGQGRKATTRSEAVATDQGGDQASVASQATATTTATGTESVFSDSDSEITMPGGRGVIATMLQAPLLNRQASILDDGFEDRGTEDEQQLVEPDSKEAMEADRQRQKQLLASHAQLHANAQPLLKPTTGSFVHEILGDMRAQASARNSKALLTGNRRADVALAQFEKKLRVAGGTTATLVDWQRVSAVRRSAADPADAGEAVDPGDLDAESASQLDRTANSPGEYGKKGSDNVPYAPEDRQRILEAAGHVQMSVVAKAVEKLMELWTVDRQSLEAYTRELKMERLADDRLLSLLPSNTMSPEKLKSLGGEPFTPQVNTRGESMGDGAPAQACSPGLSAMSEFSGSFADDSERAAADSAALTASAGVSAVQELPVPGTRTLGATATMTTESAPVLSQHVLPLSGLAPAILESDAVPVAAGQHDPPVNSFAGATGEGAMAPPLPRSTSRSAPLGFPKRRNMAKARPGQAMTRGGTILPICSSTAQLAADKQKMQRKNRKLKQRNSKRIVKSKTTTSIARGGAAGGGAHSPPPSGRSNQSESAASVYGPGDKQDRLFPRSAASSLESSDMAAGVGGLDGKLRTAPCNLDTGITVKRNTMDGFRPAVSHTSRRRASLQTQDHLHCVGAISAI